MGKLVNEHVVNILKIISLYGPKGHDWREYWGDVFIKCLQAEPRYNKNKNSEFVNFLYPAIKGSMVDARFEKKGMKRKQINKERGYLTIFTDCENFLPVEHDTAEDKYIKKELEFIFIRYCARLPYTQKIVVWLYFYEDFKIKEIGEMIGVTEGRVSQIKKDAIDKLKKKLKKPAKGISNKWQNKQEKCTQF